MIINKTIKIQFSHLAITFKKKNTTKVAIFLLCDPSRYGPRTLDKIIDTLIMLDTRGELPDLSSIPGFLRCKFKRLRFRS